MAHFYGGIDGSRGPATRMGTQASGFQAYAQGWGSRIGVRFHYDSTCECDDASIHIGGGPGSNAGSRSIGLPNIDMIVRALDSGDPKVNRIWERITTEFDKLAAESEKAVVRQDRRREREARAEARERERARAERKRIVSEMTGPEKLRLHKLLDMEFDAAGEPVSTDPLTDANLRYDMDASTVLIEARLPDFKRRWQRFTFDVSNGMWVLDFDPEDVGIADVIDATGYGWRLDSAVAA
jgi:hypothetical protein